MTYCAVIQKVKLFVNPFFPLQAGGQSYPVPAGRRDGKVSTSQEALGNLPPPSAEVDQMTQAFANKGFTQSEMVALSGTYRTLNLAFMKQRQLTTYLLST
jgi:Peroxidase